jgi:hypothetical protein
MRRDSPVMVVLFCLSRSGCPTYTSCPVLAVLFLLSCPPVLFCLSCSTCPVQPVLSAYPTLPVLFRLPGLSVLFCLSVFPVLFCLSCSACPVLAVLIWCPVLAVYRHTSTKFQARKSRSANVRERKIKERKKRA